jgi:hypothetical protein
MILGLPPLEFVSRARPLFQRSTDIGSPRHLRPHCSSSVSSLWILHPCFLIFLAEGLPPVAAPRARPHLLLATPPSRWPDAGVCGADSSGCGLCSRGQTCTTGPGAGGRMRAVGRGAGDRRLGCGAGGRRERSRECVVGGELHLWVVAPT